MHDFMHGILSGNMSEGLASADQADQEKQDDSAQNSHDKACQVEASYPLGPEGVHEEAADQRTNDTHDNVRQSTHLSVAAHDDACNPSSDGTEDDPKNDVHFYLRKDLNIGWSILAGGHTFPLIVRNDNK
jgi:hypothetical protein